MMLLVQLLALSRASGKYCLRVMSCINICPKKKQNRDGLEFFYSEIGRLQAIRDGQCFNGKWSTTEEDLPVSLLTVDGAIFFCKRNLTRACMRRLQEHSSTITPSEFSVNRLV